MKHVRCNGVAGLLCRPEEVKDLAELCGYTLSDDEFRWLGRAYSDGVHEPEGFHPIIVSGRHCTLRVEHNTSGGWIYHVRVSFNCPDPASALRVLANMVGENENTLFAGGYELSRTGEEGDLRGWIPWFEGTIMQAILFLLAQARE